MDVELTNYEEELRKILSTEVTDSIKIKGYIDTGLSSEMFQDLMGFGASPDHAADSDSGSTSSDDYQEIIVTTVDPKNIVIMSAAKNIQPQAILQDKTDFIKAETESLFENTKKSEVCEMSRENIGRLGQ